MIFILYLFVKFIIKQEYLDKIMNLFCSTNTKLVIWESKASMKTFDYSYKYENFTQGHNIS